MGFYGNIKNTSRTQFSFDKIYPNRVEMDANASLDGIYAGRFVLIEYDSAVNVSSYPIGYLKDGILYRVIPDSDDTNPVPYQVITSEDTAGAEGLANPGTIVRVPKENNFDEESAFTQFYSIGNTNVSKEKVPLYYFDIDPNTKEKVLTKKDDKTIDLVVATFSLIKGATGEGATSIEHYQTNFDIDKWAYGISRGYDSTVWQKTYEGNSSKYVMVAELNTVVPTFDISSDAPSMMPVIPHFDIDSTNVYYNLHWQPQWGFRIKASKASLKTPILANDGTESYGQHVLASTSTKDYPSDQTTSWYNTVYNVNNKQVSEKVFVTDNGNSESGWVSKENVANGNDQIGAAIYFNKAGFNPAKIAYSTDELHEGWDDNLVSDEITLSPSGRSGHSYNSHDPTVAKDTLPDTQELAIMLPSVGDAMAKIWDLIYGGRNLSVNGDEKTRHLDTTWYNAKAVQNKPGIRMAKMRSPGQFDYNKEAASTVAGVLNSVQDLLGMIITDTVPDKAENANDDYIYYDKTAGQYMFKHKTFDYTEYPRREIPDDFNPFKPISLDKWDNRYFYIDTARKEGNEYILENAFYPERLYVPRDSIEKAMKPVVLGSEYKNDGSFYIKSSSQYPSVNGITGATYTYFESTEESYSPDRTYYSFTKSDKQLEKGDAIYIPNTYYYTVYTPVELTNTTYEPNVYYYLFTTQTEVPIYRLDDSEIRVEGRQYFKRTYVLDTSLTKQDYTYYSLKPNSGQTSNSYYRQIKTAKLAEGLTYKMYTDGNYYYKINGKPTDYEDNISLYEQISDQWYQKDTVSYGNEEEWKKAGHTYYSIEITYELVQGSDIIEIIDDPSMVERVEHMTSLNDFKNYDVETDSGQDVYYIYSDSLGHKQYIEVNYNNFKKGYNSSTKNYEFVVMKFAKIGKPYSADSYYYKITDSKDPKAGSYLIDNLETITPNRQYYSFDPTKDEDGNIIDPEQYTPRKLEGYYCGDKYYVEYPKGSGNYILATDKELIKNKDYYVPSKLYVLEDSEGIYTKGAEWPLEIKKIPDTVKLAERKEVWEFKVLEDFNNQLTTLYGMVLNLYKHLDKTDLLTRDDTTARGSINLFQDLIHRFSKLVPGQFVLVDDYGRMHSAILSTKQKISYPNPTTTDKVSPVSKENALITIDIDSNFKQPTISITHSDANTTDDTKTEIDLNKSGDTFTTETPLVDNAGHVVGKNIRTITLPYTFQTITTNGLDTDESINASTALGKASTVADKSKDTLHINSGNKWIRIEASTSNNEDNSKKNNIITIKHDVHETTKTDSEKSLVNEKSENVTFEVPSYSFDKAGHFTTKDIKTITMPFSYGIFIADEGTPSKASATFDTFAINGDSWLKTTVEKDKMTLTHIGPVAPKTEIKEVADVTPKFGETFAIEDWRFDEKGHKNWSGTHKVTIPKGSYENTPVSTNAIGVITSIGFTPETGKITSSSNFLGAIQLGSYTAPSQIVATEVDNAILASNITTTTSLEDALKILDARIMRTEETISLLDYSFTAPEGSFISSITEKNGKIVANKTELEPTLTVTADLNTVPNINFSINSKTATSPITIATTKVYGVTKLISEYDNTNESLAITGKGVNSALATLNSIAVTLTPDQTISSIVENNGIITVVPQKIKIDNTNIDDDTINQSKINGLGDSLLSLQKAINQKQNTIPENTYDTFGAAEGVKTEILGGANTTIQALLDKIADLEKAIKELQDNSSSATN